MASRVLRDLKVFNSFYNFERIICFNKIFQQSSCITVLNSNKNEKFQYYSDRNYGAILTAIAACSLLYGFKDKLKVPFSLFPTVHAISKTNDSHRQKYNFIADVVEKCGDSVVCVDSRMLLRGGVQNVVPGGSGFIVKDDGLILTNAHVVVNRPNSIVQVKLKDGRIFTGQIEDVDLAADLATVRIKAENLPVMKLGSSRDLRAGEWVVAIGSPLSFSNSVTAGVVSFPQRKGEELGINFKDMQYIQTDAAIVFGNSGGPLVNLDGEAVGVNSMKVTSGISFAIPIEYAKDFLKRSEEKGKNVGEQSTSEKKRCYIGVSMLTLTPELLHELNHKNHQIPEFLINSILVCQVIIGSPAYHCGLQPGDLIFEINGVPVNGVRSLCKALEAGVQLTMKIFRQNMALMIVISPEVVI